MWGSQTGAQGEVVGMVDGASGCPGNIRRGQPRPGVVRRAVPDQVRSTLRTEGCFSSGTMRGGDVEVKITGLGQEGKR